VATLRDIGIGRVVAGLGGALIAFLTSPTVGLIAAASLGVLLIALDAAWRRWQRPKTVARRLDKACIYVIENRALAEGRAQAEAAFHLGAFELPVPGKGFVGEPMYGLFTVAEAREAFFRLEQLDVIEQTYSDANRTEYRWTKLGAKVKESLSEKPATP